MIYIKLLITFILLALLVSRSGPRQAVWWIWPVGLTILPERLIFQVGGTGVRLTFLIVIGFFALWRLVSTRKPEHPVGFALLDLAVLGMLLVDLMSKATNNLLGPSVLPNLATHYLPYIVGRLYLQNSDELPEAMRLMVRVLLISAAIALVETLVRKNLLGYFYGMSSSLIIRNGLGRARVSGGHPIQMGLIYVMMLPWALEASSQARARYGPKWWRLGPIATALGLLATLSRGPCLAGVGTALIDRFFRRPRLRIPIFILVVGSIIAVNNYQEPLIKFASAIVGDIKDEGKETYVTINGSKYLYTGTRHRILLYLAYADGMANAGLFGFDLNWVNWTPPEAPIFWSIDNHYIRLRMTRGSMGHGLLIAAIVLALYNFLRAALPVNRPQSGLAGALFGAMLCIAIIIYTVALSNAAEAAILFTMGLAVTMRRLPTIIHEELDEDDFDMDDDDTALSAEHEVIS